MKKNLYPKILLFLFLGIIFTYLTGNLNKGIFLPFGWSGTCISWWGTEGGYQIRTGAPFIWTLSNPPFVPTKDFPYVPLTGCFGALNFIAILLNVVFFASILLLLLTLIRRIEKYFSGKH
jgi:hypothetical protein